MKYRVAAAVLATMALLGSGSAAAFAGDDHEARPVLAETGYDFTPMLVTAAVFLLIAGVAVIVAKYFVARTGAR
jgi:heme/copper-type cytochrome/quinol oxidase subunit 2